MSSLALVTVAAFGLAAVATFLDWFTFGSRGATGWADHTRYKIADVLKVTAPIDAIVILALAGAGAFMLLAPLLGRRAPAIPFATLIAGVALAGVGVAEYLYIHDVSGGVPGLDVGIGVYLLIGAGAVAAVCSLIAAQRAGQAGGMR